jgi:hypothetical protein
MEEFSTFLKLGFQHITDPGAYDHLLFIVTLCAAFGLADWKKVLILITAFTLGHSLTLALSALQVIQVPSALVEMLIPVTILLTSLNNVLRPKTEGPLFAGVLLLSYLFALLFGLIHGMGFAGYFSTLLGSEDHIVKPLFAFNVGVELGQLSIVVVLFALLALISQFKSIRQREWNLYLSGAGGGVALTMIIDGLLQG